MSSELNKFLDINPNTISIIKYLQSKKLLHSQRSCHRCQKKDMTLDYRPDLKNDEFGWRCTTCKSRCALRVGTWFEGIALSFSVLLRAIVYWAVHVTEDAEAFDWSTLEPSVAEKPGEPSVAEKPVEHSVTEKPGEPSVAKPDDECGALTKVSSPISAFDETSRQKVANELVFASDYEIDYPKQVIYVVNTVSKDTKKRVARQSKREIWKKKLK